MPSPFRAARRLAAISLALLGFSATGCRREAPRPDPVAPPPITIEPEASSGARARAAPDGSSALLTTIPRGIMPTRCRALVNVAVSPRSDRFPIHHVVEVRVDEKISLSSAQGLVIQDDQGLVGLQLVHYELTSNTKGAKLSRQWSSLLARRLPDGPPSVWMNGEIEPPDLEGNPGDWYSINAFTVTATIGPFVSLSGHHSLGTGAVYFGDDWPALTFAAPDGQRASLTALLDSAEMTTLMARLSPAGGADADAALGASRDQFAWTFGGGDGASGLHLQAGSETPSPGDRVRFEKVPTGLSPHLLVAGSSPGRVGHPRGCAEIEMGGGAIRVWPRGAAGEVKVPLPAPLRSAVFLGVAWVSLDDPFKLAQLSPSGYATSKSIRGAPAVKYPSR